MLPPPTLPLSGHCGLSQNATVGSTGALLSGRDWPRYLSGCSLGPLSTTSPFALPRFPGVLSRYPPRSRERRLGFDPCSSGIPYPSGQRPPVYEAGSAPGEDQVRNLVAQPVLRDGVDVAVRLSGQ